ncbi:hypothetical protein [Halobacteriovorax sp. HLS]|uniref:hypothetical protein n=1 Tax=Halobacteriovorax sp. HLS TaxID=2234000 RepID=UPI000FD7E7FB|nr:hypothetical protein [Halobacteriovorax sp. HLS]
MQSLKLLVFIMATLSSLSLFAGQEEHPGHPPTRNDLVEGIVHYGPTLQCEIWNDARRPIRVINYTYNIWYRGPNGRALLATRRFDCRYNCRVGEFSSQIFTGPLNNGPTISASCNAIIRRAHQ